MSELKPCPFCGIKPELVSLVTPVRYFYHCPNCGVGNELQGFDSDEAQRFWNTRPIEDALNARIAELEQENARLREAIEKIREITAEFSYDRKLEQIRDIVNQFPPPEADNEIPSL